jgi:hypothetical protein
MGGGETTQQKEKNHCKAETRVDFKRESELPGNPHFMFL